MSDKTNVKKLKPGTFVLGGSVLRRTIHWISASVARLIEIFMRGVKRVKKGEILEYAESATGLLVEGHVKTAKSPKVDITKEGKVDKIETSKEADVCGTLGGECAETIKDLSCHLTVFGGGVVRGNLHVKSAVLYPGSLFSGKLTAENDIVVYGGATGQTELISNNGVVKVHPKADVGYVFYKGQWYHPLGEHAQVCEPMPAPAKTLVPGNPPAPLDLSRFTSPVTSAKPVAKPPVDREPEGTEVPMGMFAFLTQTECSVVGEKLLTQLKELEGKLNTLMVGRSNFPFKTYEDAQAISRQALALSNMAKQTYKAIQNSFNDEGTVKFALERLNDAALEMQKMVKKLEDVLVEAGVVVTTTASVTKGLDMSSDADIPSKSKVGVRVMMETHKLLGDAIEEAVKAEEVAVILSEALAEIAEGKKHADLIEGASAKTVDTLITGFSTQTTQELEDRTSKAFFRTREHNVGMVKKTKEIGSKLLALSAAVQPTSLDDETDKYLKRELDQTFGRNQERDTRPDGRAPATRKENIVRGQGDRHPPQNNGPKARPEAKPAPKDAGSQTHTPVPGPTSEKDKDVSGPAQLDPTRVP